MNTKDYVLKRYDGGHPKIVMTVDQDQYITMSLINKGERWEKHYGSDIHFYADTVLVTQFNSFRSIYLFFKRLFRLITQEQIVALAIAKNVKNLEQIINRRRNSMLRLIREVDDVTKTLNGRAK